MVAAGGFGVCGSGSTWLNNQTTPLYDCWEYNPAHDSWESAQAFPESRFDSEAFQFSGYGFACGTVVGRASYTNGLWEYTADPPTRTLRIRWSIKTLAAKTPRIRWSVERDPVIQISKIRWGIRTIAAHDATILWHIGGPVSHTTKVRWWIGDIAAHVTKVRWKLFNPPVEKTVMIRWGTRTVAQTLARVRWRVGPTCSEPITFKVWGQSGTIARSADVQFRDCVD